MRTRSYRAGARWAIILAGGEGSRLSRLTVHRFGEHRPKQYCSFLGQRTMFEHTLDRAVAFAGRQRIVTVIGHGHMRFLNEPKASQLYGYVIEQPRNCDTAPGVLLPLAYVLAHDADATVAIFPSDHYIYPNAHFLRCMDRAAAVAERHPDRLVLAAAVADRPEVEYGWIQPGEPIAGEPDIRSVSRFHEKPDPELAVQFHRDGFVWNTLNMAVKGKMLWDLACARHPAMMERFDRMRAAIGTPYEGATLASIYDDMPFVNFSKSLLEHAAGQALVLPMRGIEWSDWGRPERIQEILERRSTSAPAANSLLAPRPLIASAA